MQSLCSPKTHKLEFDFNRLKPGGVKALYDFNSVSHCGSCTLYPDKTYSDGCMCERATLDNEQTRFSRHCADFIFKHRICEIWISLSSTGKKKILVETKHKLKSLHSMTHTVSFSLSLDESPLDGDGVWAGVLGVECPLVSPSVIAFFCIFFF